MEENNESYEDKGKEAKKERKKGSRNEIKIEK